MYEDVKEHFKEKGCYKKTQEKAHSQIEIRKYYQTEDIGWMEQKKEWKGLKSIAMEKKTRRKDGVEKAEYRYFISSWKEDIELIGRAVRGHWSIRILKTAEASRHRLFMKKKRYVIGLCPIKHLEDVLNSKKRYRRQIKKENHSCVCRGLTNDYLDQTFTVHPLERAHGAQTNSRHYCK